MSKTLTQRSRNGTFVLGRSTAEKISAVEGSVRSERTGRIIAASDKVGETGDARRSRIKAEFQK